MLSGADSVQEDVAEAPDSVQEDVAEAAELSIWGGGRMFLVFPKP